MRHIQVGRVGNEGGGGESRQHWGGGSVEGDSEVAVWQLGIRRCFVRVTLTEAEKLPVLTYTCCRTGNTEAGVIHLWCTAPLSG